LATLYQKLSKTVDVRPARAVSFLGHSVYALVLWHVLTHW